VAEPNKQQIGDGGDNIGQAAQKTAEAAKQISKAAAEKAAVAGAEATSTAAGASVAAAAQGGQAAASVAAGTAAGGPVGAILAAAWAMRHTLVKILVCICLILVFFITAIISLPSIIFNQTFRTDPDSFDPNMATDPYKVYEEMSVSVSDCVSDGYDYALAEVERIIEEGGYDYEYSMEALINYGHTSADYDICYVLAAYSASMEQRGTTKSDMQAKLRSVMKKMFPVTYVEKEKERIIPLTYSTYQSTTVTVITGKTQTGVINGVPQYRYTTGTRTYYVESGTEVTTEPVTRTAYRSVTVEVPIYSGGTVTGSESKTYYEAAGTETLTPETEMVKYAECTIHPFDQSVILTAFNIDTNATYNQFNITYGEAIYQMSNALKMTLYSSVGSGDVPPLTDAELIAFLNQLNCSATRKELIRVGLSLVGRVPYFWGGKSGPGWNDEWNTPKLVTAAGSPTTGTIRPYGLDCSGFTDWVYKTVFGKSLYAGTWNQWDNTTAITEAELLPGDLGFMAVPGTVPVNHVLIYAGKKDGKQMWVHCASGTGVVLNSPSYVTQFRRPIGFDLESNTPPNGGSGIGSGTPTGPVIETLTVDVTHYCPCSKCCGQWADGITASGKKAARGMVAMSSVWPFGTQIMINGTMYTVEDRGGSGIESNRGRVDIFVPSHQEALRLGRYTTTAYIYRIGR